MDNTLTIGVIAKVNNSLTGDRKIDTVESNSPDYKLTRIINKFKSGKKLTGGELSYLAKNAPDTYMKVLRVMKRREMLEQRLERAKTKEEAARVLMEEMQSIEKISSDSGDDFEKTAALNHAMDAYNGYLSGEKRGGGSIPSSDVLEDAFAQNKRNDPNDFFSRRPYACKPRRKLEEIYQIG